jgi:protein TonB
LRVSQGVSQGLLLKKVAPVYPPEALRLRKEGVVQLVATVSKAGNISNVRILGGDPTLAQAAADAVLRWKYRPYLLNGEPVEIETQISVVFKAPQ